MSYYDVNAILTDAEKIPCEFQIDVPGLGYLDHTPAHTLRAGTRLQLPLWLAEMLALANPAASHNDDDDDGNNGNAAAASARPFLTLNLPPALAPDVLQALKADPRAVPLRDQSAHFYALATRMLDLFEERDLAAVLRAAFVGRAAEIRLHGRKMGGSSAVGGSGGSSSSGGGGGDSGDRGGGGRGGGGGGGTGDKRDSDGNSHNNNNNGTSSNTSSNLGIGWAGQEFLRGLDEWERQLFRQAHDGAKAGREFLDNVKRNY
ncbi:gins complex subunit [Niveomyces insectorum RCEF 264]|uniref:DNA replication complex GINS protein PSF3 n=1 Tax=Niveomyces insectorum RCEF 264 TaxID=1081102 RepID=A0A167RCN0_9HYPO|nr:gins complex subunit [Niveomyces insectorum RCEF 264]